MQFLWQENWEGRTTDPRRDPRASGRPQGTVHDADRQRCPLGQRSPTPDAHAVRRDMAGAQHARGADPVRGRRSGDRPREHRGSIQRGGERFTGDVVVSMKIATPVACHRIALWAFRYATHRKRRRVSVFHKANTIRDHGGGLLERASGSLGLHGCRCAAEFSAGGVPGKLPPLRRGRPRCQRGGKHGGTAATPVADAGSRIEAGSLPWARWGLDSKWCL